MKNPVLKNKQFIFSLLLIFTSTVFLSGCETLRKKFTREKKKKDNLENPDFIPVLDPIDYPEKAENPFETYKYRYSMWQIWQKDAVKAFEIKKGNEKRKRYVLEQIHVQLEEMHTVLQGEKQQKMVAVIERVENLQDQMKIPEKMRNEQGILREIHSIGRVMRNNFSSKVVEEEFNNL